MPVFSVSILTPSLTNDRTIALKAASSFSRKYSTRCMPANWYSIVPGMSAGSRYTGMIGFLRSEARASSLTTFSDSVEFGEIDSNMTLQSRMALTISWLHIVATSMPAWSIHTVTPALRNLFTRPRTRSRSFAA